jgi:uncharacterized membrane protein
MAPPEPNPRPSASGEPAAGVYAAVYHALFYGMLVSTVLYALGVVSALRHPMTIPLDQPFHQSWSQVLRGLVHLDPVSLMLTATVLLILTPVTRVAVACAAFLADGDRKFAAVTAVVLGVIALTVVLGSLGLH